MYPFHIRVENKAIDRITVLEDQSFHLGLCTNQLSKPGQLGHHVILSRTEKLISALSIDKA
jgi:hypothetical protein